MRIPASIHRVRFDTGILKKSLKTSFAMFLQSREDLQKLEVYPRHGSRE